MITGKNYIGNKLSAKGNKTFTTFNAASNAENPWIFYEAIQDEVEEAVALAKNACIEFGQTSLEQRAKFLETIATEILNLGDELIQTYCLESSLPEARAIGERGRTIFQLQSFAAHIKKGTFLEASIDTAIPNREPVAKPDLRKLHIPMGTVVVFGASNFPLAYSTAGGDTASALAAGCPVIVKSHPMHAGTGELIASAIQKAVRQTHMPNGVFSNLNSSDHVIGELLVKHPNVKAVGFTGSIKGGRALFNLASQREEPIPVFAEMGSINPVVLLPKIVETKAQEIADSYANSITLGVGQFCTNPGLILGIKSDALQQFASTLATNILQIQPGIMLHPNIKTNYNKNKFQMIAQNDVNLLADLTSTVAANVAQQALVAVDGSVFLENKTLHQEVFGPFSMLVMCDDAHQLEQIIHQLEGQLTGTIYGTKDEMDLYKDIILALQTKVGRIIFNGVPTGVEVCESMTHGGPYPASTDSRFTAVGVNAIKRWLRPFSYQNWPDQLLPLVLQNSNPLQILRSVNGIPTKDSL